MSLVFNKKVEWDGNFTALEDITFNDTITLRGVSNKNPIDNHESGGALFQGVKKIAKELKISSMKYSLENVEKISDKITISEKTIGNIKNCLDMKSLTTTGQTELQFLRTKFSDDVSIETGRGEIIDTELKNLTIKNSGFILRNHDIKNSLSTENCFIESSNFLISESWNDKNSTIHIDTINARQLLTNTSVFNGSKITNSGSSVIYNTVGLTQFITSNNFNLSRSSILTQSIVGNVNVDSSSSFVGLSGNCNLSTSGAVILTKANADVNVNNNGFIGVSVSGSSNFSSLKSGVDILAVPRINNRTSDDFVAEAQGSIYMVASGSLLNQAGSSIDSVAGSSNLVKGSSVYCVGNCHFTPSDKCTAEDCSKPIWLSGGKGQSVRLQD